MRAQPLKNENGREAEQAFFAFEATAQRVCQQLAQATQAPCYLLPPADRDFCRFLYVLCVGRPPPLIRLRNKKTLPDFSATPLTDQYLRVALSVVSPAACVQEVTVTASLQTTSSGIEAVFVEKPRAGLYEPSLLARFSKVVDVLSAYGFRSIDVALLETSASANCTETTQEESPARRLFSHFPLLSHSEQRVPVWQHG